MAKDIIKTFTPSIKARGHSGRSCLSHGSGFDVKGLLSLHFTLICCFFLFKSH
jgi:hypothetical protein